MRKYFLLFTVLLCISNAQAQTSSGAASIGGGSGGINMKQSGFNCGNGMSWQVEDGVARCAIALAATPTGAACAADPNFTSGACTFSVVASQHGGVVSASNMTTGYTGALSLLCSNGAYGVTSVSCVPNPCASTPYSSGGCSYTLPAKLHGQSASASFDSGPGGYSGSISGTCSLGNWSIGGISCVANPPPVCGNGASNYPTCTFPPPPTCGNGASNYPVCTFPVPPPVAPPVCTSTSMNNSIACSAIAGLYGIPAANTSGTAFYTMETAVCKFNVGSILSTNTAGCIPPPHPSLRTAL